MLSPLPALWFIPFNDIQIPSNRQRRQFSPDSIQALADSIDKNGLIHPVVIRKRGSDYFLVAGERRMRALATMWNIGQMVKVGGLFVSEGTVPCIDYGELDPISAMEVELEENIRRVDLTWQEQAQATADLLDLRKKQAMRDNEIEPTVKDIAVEIRGSGEGIHHEAIRQQLIVARHLSDPDVMKAKSAPEAIKILKRKEELRRSEALGVSVGKTFSAKDHALFKGDCLTELQRYKEAAFDIILSDPPYGMGAESFGDSDGKARVEGHFYDDSYESWVDLMSKFIPLTWTITKPQAHMYLFCDFDRFHELKGMCEAYSGWKVFRTPLIWHNPTSMRLPWIESGPQRKYQLCLYATKGGKHVNKIFPDLVTYPSDANLNHPAQKPVGLFTDLLSRSALPGDSVIDPFCGTGTIFPAAHALKVKAVGIEKDPEAYGIAVKRLGELK